MRSTALALPLLLGGCSPTYIPLGTEHYVSITLHTGNGDPVGSKDGVPYHAIMKMCIAKELDHRFCGRRLVLDGYDEDTFEVDSDMYGSFEVECIDEFTNDAWSFLGMKESHCAVRVPEAKPGWEFRFTVNELTGSAVTMPALSSPTSPAANSEISVSAIGSIEMTWEPSSEEGDALEWEIFRSFAEVPEGCGEEADWGDVGRGDIEDTGAFTLAKDLLPTNLPPGGCSVDLTLIRTRMGRFDPGIKSGDLVARQFGSTRVTLKP
jgi:hypothetical protein